MKYPKEIEAVLISKDQIGKRVEELAQEISRDYQNKSVLLVGVLRGAVVFLADLIRHLSIPVTLDFMAISSYGSSTKTSGVVRILKDLDENIENRHLLLIEDITDTGLTLSYLVKNLKSRSPASVEICSFLSKKNKQKLPVKIKYCGFEIPDKFVVGYGLDYDQKYRNLPEIYTLKPE